MDRLVTSFLTFATVGFCSALLHPAAAAPLPNGTFSQRCEVAVDSAETSATAQACDRLSRLLAQRSITVVGQGQVTAPADTALLEFRVSSREPLNASENRAPGLSLQVNQQVTEEALKPTVTALTSIDVPARDITVQITSSLQNPKLLVKLNKPTQERIQQVVLTVDRSLQNSTQLFLQSIGAGYSVNSCQLLERSVRRTALRDAQNQIRSLAVEVGVQVGELLYVTAFPLAGSVTSVGCGSKAGVPTSGASLLSPTELNEATPPYDPSAKPEVQLRGQVSMTYAIQAVKK